MAVDFRKKNPEASLDARDNAIRYYVRSNPGEPDLRRFYTEMGTFGEHPVTVSGNLTENRDYWTALRWWIWHYGGFGSSEEEARKAYYAYWAGQMQGKFRDDVEYGDDQYARLQSRADWRRTLKWIRLYQGRLDKTQQYFRKIDLRQPGKDGLAELMKALWETPDGRPLARGTARRGRKGPRREDVGNRYRAVSQKPDSLSGVSVFGETLPRCPRLRGGGRLLAEYRGPAKRQEDARG